MENTNFPQTEIDHISLEEEQIRENFASGMLTFDFFALIYGFSSTTTTIITWRGKISRRVGGTLQILKMILILKNWKSFR